MFLFGLFSINAQTGIVPKSSNLDQLVDLEWSIYQEQNANARANLLIRKSKIYSEQQELDLALKSIERINIYELSEELKSVVLEEKILIQYLMGSHEQAKNSVLESSLIESYIPSDDIKLVEILNLVAIGSFTEAQVKFEALNQEANSEEIFNVKKLKKSQRAFNLSLITPGTGQIYAGYLFKGIGSLAIQGVLFYSGVKGLQRRYFFTQALPSVAVFQGFYFGGAQYATELVEKRNAEIKAELGREIIQSFQ